MSCCFTINVWNNEKVIINSQHYFHVYLFTCIMYVLKIPRSRLLGTDIYSYVYAITIIIKNRSSVSVEIDYRRKC